MWDSRSLVTYIWGTFDVVVFKVVLESFSAQNGCEIETNLGLVDTSNVGYH